MKSVKNQTLVWKKVVKVERCFVHKTFKRAQNHYFYLCDLEAAHLTSQTSEGTGCIFLISKIYFLQKFTHPPLRSVRSNGQPQGLRGHFQADFHKFYDQITFPLGLFFLQKNFLVFRHFSFIGCRGCLRSKKQTHVFQDKMSTFHDYKTPLVSS